MAGARGVVRRSRGKTTSAIAPGLYQCPYCDLAYEWRCNLTTHIRQKHFAFRRPVCTQCGASFRDMQVLARHTVRFHTTGCRILKCLHCRKKFKLEISIVSSSLRSRSLSLPLFVLSLVLALVKLPF